MSHRQTDVYQSTVDLDPEEPASTLLQLSILLRQRHSTLNSAVPTPELRNGVDAQRVFVGYSALLLLSSILSLSLTSLPNPNCPQPN